MKTDYDATILGDSITLDGVRVTTMEVTFPRPYLAELNTHRLISRDGYEQELSRNSASSRAIPTEKNIERVLRHPYVPATFNKRVKGMGVGEELDAVQQVAASDLWLAAAGASAGYANQLNEIGIDKSRANRLLEPFMWHTAILTATEWENFFGLRCPDGDEVDYTFPAQPEIQQLAILMRKALRGSEPKELEQASWHAPMFDWDEEFEILRGHMGGIAVPMNEAINGALLVASRRLARVSFDKHSDDELIMLSYNKGVELAQLSHYSPMEHCVRPITTTDLSNPNIAPKLHAPLDMFRNHRNVNHEKIDLARVWAGNLRGVIQFRKLLPNEDNAMLKRVATAAKDYEEATA